MPFLAASCGAGKTGGRRPPAATIEPALSAWRAVKPGQQRGLFLRRLADARGFNGAEPADLLWQQIGRAHV